MSVSPSSIPSLIESVLHRISPSTKLATAAQRVALSFTFLAPLACSGDNNHLYGESDSATSTYTDSDDLDHSSDTTGADSTGSGSTGTTGHDLDMGEKFNNCNKYRSHHYIPIEFKDVVEHQEEGIEKVCDQCPCPSIAHATFEFPSPYEYVQSQGIPVSRDQYEDLTFGSVIRIRFSHINEPLTLTYNGELETIIDPQDCEDGKFKTEVIIKGPESIDEPITLELSASPFGFGNYDSGVYENIVPQGSVAHQFIHLDCKDE